MRAILRLVAAVFLPTLAFAAEPGSGQTEKPALRFLSYDINPRNPNDITVQISIIGGRTYFLEIGGAIPGTKLKVEKFVPNRTISPRGESVDSSQIVVTDTVSGKVTSLTVANPVEMKLK